MKSQLTVILSNQHCYVGLWFLGFSNFLLWGGFGKDARVRTQERTQEMFQVGLAKAKMVKASGLLPALLCPTDLAQYPTLPFPVSQPPFRNLVH